MKLFNKLCCCIPLDKGCVWIAVCSIAFSGIMLMIQVSLWSIVGFVLSVASSASLIIGTIKQLKLGIIIYLVLEMIQVIETFVSTIIVLVDVTLYENSECGCDSHECETSKNFCNLIGKVLGGFGGLEVLISTYFWICVLSYYIKITDSEKVVSVA